MEFVYKPEGVEKRWPFDPDDLMVDEAELIERYTKLSFAEWLAMVNRGSMLAYRALLFVFLRRDDPGLKWESLKFKAGDVDVVFDDGEVDAWIKALEAQQAAGKLDDDDEELLAMFKASRAAPDEPPPDDTDKPDSDVVEVGQGAPKARARKSA